jgi:hypothetical protein
MKRERNTGDYTVEDRETERQENREQREREAIGQRDPRKETGNKCK